MSATPIPTRPETPFDVDRRVRVTVVAHGATRQFIGQIIASAVDAERAGAGLIPRSVPWITVLEDTGEATTIILGPGVITTDLTSQPTHPALG